MTERPGCVTMGGGNYLDYPAGFPIENPYLLQKTNMKMATISTFELLVKRIAPLVPGNPGGVNEAFRRVVQGYFLTIANPNERLVRFRMRAHLPTLSVDSPFPEIARELVAGNPSTRNHVFTYDITGGPVFGQVAFDSMDFAGTFCEGNKDLYSTPTLLLPPCQTATVKLLPDITSPVIDLADPQLEVRGYIDLVQVVSIEFSQGDGGLVQVRFEEPDPVDLLITPEIRGTFLDNDYPTPGGASLDFDQLAYSLPTATGAATMTVREAVNPFFIFPRRNFLPPFHPCRDG